MKNQLAMYEDSENTQETRGGDRSQGEVSPWELGTLRGKLKIPEVQSKKLIY
jgi:hypothetical protein